MICYNILCLYYDFFDRVEMKKRGVEVGGVLQNVFHWGGGNKKVGGTTPTLPTYILHGKFMSKKIPIYVKCK